MTRDDSTTTQKVDKRLLLSGKNRVFIGVAAVLALLLLIILTVNTSDQGPHRSESYKDVSGAAGLNASVDYDCMSSCENKFDFNVYIFNDSGHMVATARPDRDGNIKLAMPEGDYIMLLGKRLGRDRVFPQEPLALKNGKSLELKLQYEGGP